MSIDKTAQSTRHESVLRDEVIATLGESLSPATPKVALDCTLGGGGHAEALLEAHSSLFLAGIDRDKCAIERAANRLSRFADRCVFIQASFDELDRIADDVFDAAANYFNIPVTGCNAILADLGLSSDQLDDPTRGFSFQADGPLDMRMNREQELSAEKVLNEYAPFDLKKVFLRGGLRKGAGSLAKTLVDSRPISSTAEFRKICHQVLGTAHLVAGRRSDPATVPFQAVRIEVNDEFASLQRMLEQSFELLVPGGRLAVISFHSQEDKIVAKTMRGWSRPADEPLGLPMGEQTAQGQLLTKQAQCPDEEEVLRNPRARSARMRVFCKGVCVE